MTTRIAKLGRERSLATLAKRVYEIGDEVPPALLRLAEARLLAANPRLAASEGFASGASIVVPAVPGLRHAEKIAEADVSGAGMTAETAARLEAAQSRIDDALRLSAQSRAETAKRLGDRSFVADAEKGLPQAAEFLAAAKERLAADEKTDAEAADRLRAGIAGAIDAMKSLDALIRNRR